MFDLLGAQNVLRQSCNIPGTCIRHSDTQLIPIPVSINVHKCLQNASIHLLCESRSCLKAVQKVPDVSLSSVLWLCWNLTCRGSQWSIRHCRQINQSLHDASCPIPCIRGKRLANWPFSCSDLHLKGYYGRPELPECSAWTWIDIKCCINMFLQYAYNKVMGKRKNTPFNSVF